MKNRNENAKRKGERKEVRRAGGSADTVKELGNKSDMTLDQMVPLGNNRNNGASLGSFCINADNDLLNSNGNNWRART